MDRYNGIMPVYKEAGLTSHDVIYKLRRIIGKQKVGHTGTLDPLASGLLLICLGRATKLTRFLTEWDKSYLAEITLGAVSDTLDADGQINETGQRPDFSENEILSILDKFKGNITQKVPAYSAVKVRGRELYKYARKGQTVETPSREVEIKNLELSLFDGRLIKVNVTCSKGTYIRVLADDIGRELGCGGYVSALQRNKIGPFDICQALHLAEIEKNHEEDSLEKHIVSIERILDFPVIRIRNRARKLIKNGGLPDIDDIVEHSGHLSVGRLISVASESGEIMAIGKSKVDNVSFLAREKRNFFSYVRVLI